MNLPKAKQIFKEEVLPQLEKNSKIRDIPKCEAIFIEIVQSSLGKSSKGLRESALPDHLRPGYRYMQRMLIETDVVERKKHPADGYYLVDPINNKVYFQQDRWRITQEYFDRLRNHANKDPGVLNALAKGFNMTTNEVGNILTKIISQRDLNLFNNCVEILLGTFDLRLEKYGFLNFRKGAQYLKISDYHRKLMEP